MFLRPFNCIRPAAIASKDYAGSLVETMLSHLANAELRSMGSSLKFCLVAEGRADIYLRDFADHGMGHGGSLMCCRSRRRKRLLVRWQAVWVWQSWFTKSSNRHCRGPKLRLGRADSALRDLIPGSGVSHACIL